jgi:hypothetical protein
LPVLPEFDSQIGSDAGIGSSSILAIPAIIAILAIPKEVFGGDGGAF